jgi:hypothetical protein
VQQQLFVSHAFGKVTFSVTKMHGQPTTAVNLMLMMIRRRKKRKRMVLVMMMRVNRDSDCDDEDVDWLTYELMDRNEPLSINQIKRNSEGERVQGQDALTPFDQHKRPEM